MSPISGIQDNLLVICSFHLTLEGVKILPIYNQYSHPRTYRMSELSTWCPTILSLTKESILMQKLKMKSQLWGTLVLQHQEAAVSGIACWRSTLFVSQRIAPCEFRSCPIRCSISTEPMSDAWCYVPTATSPRTKEVWLYLHTITLSEPPAEFVLSITAKLVSAKLDILVPDTSANR